MYLNKYRKNESIKRSSLIYAPTNCQSDFPPPSVLGVNRYVSKNMYIYQKILPYSHIHIHYYLWSTYYVPGIILKVFICIISVNSYYQGF